VCDPPVSVYKGYSLSKDTQNYLVSRGLKNALYTIRAADLIEDLLACLFLALSKYDPASIERATSSNDVSKKRYVEMLELDNVLEQKSRSVNWNDKEHTYLSFVDCQSRAFQELRAAMKSVKNKVLKTKRSYSEDFKYF
ncbi:hypothetical protein HN873_018837, partial [Arachis hypogaea]